jgi:hypothetical protein
MNFQSKTIFALFVVSSAFLLTATSCKKSNSSSSNSNGQFSASISGTAWASNFPTSGIYSTSGQEFEIGGGQYKGGDSTIITLVFFSPITLNMAISSDTALVDVGYVNANTVTEYDGGIIAGHSILTITSYDSVNHKVGGTFTGVLYNISGGSDSVVVTGGSFSSSYIVTN